MEMLPTIAADMEPLNHQGLLEALGAERHLPAHEKGGEGDCERRMVTDKRIGESELIEGDIVVVAMESKSLSVQLESSRAEVRSCMQWVSVMSPD